MLSPGFFFSLSTKIFQLVLSRSSNELRGMLTTSLARRKRTSCSMFDLCLGISAVSQTSNYEKLVIYCLESIRGL